MAVRALLDLRLLARSDGAVLAGPHSIWRYAWPRDCSWVAVALAETGHLDLSLRILRFLLRMQSPGGTWAARYLPSGSGPVRDGRPAELDAVGWVPWAAWAWITAAGRHGRTVGAELSELLPMVTAAAGAAERSLTGDGLPRAAMDYWEDKPIQVTLGTAVPVLAGLRAAAAIADQAGDPARAGRWTAAAARLSAGIGRGFGRYGFHRVAFADSGDDAAVTFLGLPFAVPGRAVVRAADFAADALQVANGGMQPGSGWTGTDEVAWTPETAFFALFDAGPDSGNCPSRSTRPAPPSRSRRSRGPTRWCCSRCSCKHTGFRRSRPPAQLRLADRPASPVFRSPREGDALCAADQQGCRSRAGRNGPGGCGTQRRNRE
jgi:hypothetical protein